MTPSAAQRTLPTVHGTPLRPHEPAWVDGHAHAWIDPPVGVSDAAAVALRDEPLRAAALADLARAARPRRAALLDCQPPGAGRDGRVLARLSRASGVAIMATSGFHLARYYPAGSRPWSDATEACAAFRRELEVGLAELPGCRAAVIKAADTGDAASGRDGADAPWWEAAVAARAATDALLLIHTQRGAGAEHLLEWLRERGVPAERVYLCHVDKRADAALHAELASAGALLGFDTFLRSHYDPERTTWPLVHALLDAGHRDALAFGLDLASPDMWPATDASPDAPSPAGPAGLLTEVAPRLRALGATDADLDALLGGNLLLRAARPTATDAADPNGPADHA